MIGFMTFFCKINKIRLQFYILFLKRNIDFIFEGYRKNNCSSVTMPKQSIKYLALTAFVGILILHHFFAYLGHFGYDDMHYARLAHDLTNAVFNPEDHFSYRLTLVGLTSLSYRLFGVNDFASSLPSLLVSALSLLLVFIILRKEKPAILVIGLALVGLNFWTLFYSDKLMPDPLVAFSVLLAIFLIFEFKFRKTNIPTIVYAFATALAVFLGFNAKGTIVLIVPLLAYFIIVDLLKKRDMKFWGLFVGFSVILLGSYFAFWQFYSGNALARLSAITQNSYLNLCSYSEQPFLFTLKRIGYGLVLLSVSHSLIVPFIFLLASPGMTFKKETFLLNDERSFFIGSAIVLFLSSNFMSISVSSYSPMCLDPRHYLFMIPIAGVAGVKVLRTELSKRNFQLRFVGLSVLIFGIAVINNYDTAWTLYLPLVVVSSVLLILKGHASQTLVFTFLLIAALLINPAKMARYARKVNFTKQEQIVRQEVLSRQDSCLVITDQVQKNVAAYLSGFDPSSPCKFYTYDEFQSDDYRQDIPVFLLKNWYTNYLSNMAEHELPYFAKMTKNQQLIFEDRDLNIQIFQLTDFRRPEKLFQSKNNFESEIQGWSTVERSTKEVYTGSYSASVEEYSSTFSISLSRFDLDQTDQLLVNASFRMNLMDAADPQLIVTIEKDDKKEFWKGLPGKKQIKSYGNWLPVSVNQIIDMEDISSDATLILYLWNKEKAELYLDDFNVELSVIKR